MSVAHPLLSRRPAKDTPGLPLLQGCPEITLSQGRVHEASGPARRSFAVWLAAQTAGPLLWIAPSWGAETLNPDGLSAWLDPGRLIFVAPKRGEDLLWTMEEVLRSGAVAFAVADLPALPSLTQVRRMHLAAERGGQEGAHLSLGLLLTPGTGGAAGVETRWHLKPCHTSGQDHWQMERQRARTAPQKTWRLHRPASEGGPKINTA